MSVVRGHPPQILVLRMFASFRRHHKNFRFKMLWCEGWFRLNSWHRLRETSELRESCADIERELLLYLTDYDDKDGENDFTHPTFGAASCLALCMESIFKITNEAFAWNFFGKSGTQNNNINRTTWTSNNRLNLKRSRYNILYGRLLCWSLFEILR